MLCLYSDTQYYNVIIYTCIIHYTVSCRPTMKDLFILKRKDGSREQLQIISWITAHTSTKCEDFAQMLLNDPVTVRKLRKKHDTDEEEFVRATLSQWLNRDDDDEEEESLPCTWEALIKCVDDAGLDRNLVKELRNNVPGGECNLVDYIIPCTCTCLQSVSQYVIKLYRERLFLHLKLRIPYA